MSAAIEARDVRLSFGETPALRGADLTVGAGEILAVMGPSGSGRSTLLHCLAGILVPDHGEIHVAGRRIDSLGETERSAGGWSPGPRCSSPTSRPGHSTR